MHRTIFIKAFYPNFFKDKLIAYAALRIAEHLNSPSLSATVTGISSDETVRKYKKKGPLPSQLGKNWRVTRRVYFDSIPSGPIWGVFRRLFSIARIKAFAEWRYFRQLKKGEIAYLWPEVSLHLYRKIRSRGCLIVSERINTLRENSKKILDSEFESLGLPKSHGLTMDTAREELECMRLSDYIFSPSPGVTDSLLSAGIDRGKIISTSYGLDRRDFLEKPAHENGKSRICAIFVGSICIRKGIHLLLKAWERSGVDGRLVIIGRVMPEVEALFHAYLAGNHSIEHVDFVEDLHPYYRSADYFILPSLEEGSPLSTYLALGAWLPSIVSPMGAGGVIEDGKEGFIIDPHNVDEFAGAIRKLSMDASLRERMASAAAISAKRYSWDRVSARRRNDLIARIAGAPSPATASTED